MSPKSCLHLNKQHSGPPDLEAWLKKHLRFLKFKKRPTMRDIEPRGPAKSSIWWLGILGLILTVTILMSGIVAVPQNEAVVLTQFGVYAKTLKPGTHWAFPLIDQRFIVKTQVNDELRSSMLIQSQDAGLVQVNMALDYQVIDAKLYLYSALQLKNTLQAYLQSASLQSIGAENLADLLSNPDLKALAASIQANLNFDPARYGIKIEGVRVDGIAVPPAMSSQFTQTISQAQSQVKAMLAGARAYAAAITPVAEQKALALQQIANLQKSASIITAEANAAQFSALLPMYQKDPEATAAYLPMALLPSLSSLTASSSASGAQDQKISTPSNAQNAYLRWNAANETTTTSQ